MISARFIGIGLCSALLLAACDRDCVLLDSEAGYLCGDDTTTAPIETAFERPVVLARVNGMEARLLIDTGAERTILSSTFLGVADEQYTRAVDRLCIGDGFCLTDGHYFAWDTYFSKPDAGEINGMIGMDILRHFVFEMDTGRRIALSHDAPPCQGDRSPLTYTDYGSPLMDVVIDGLSLKGVLLDTGSAYSLLDAETAPLLDPYFADNGVETGGCSIDGCVEKGVFVSAISSYCIKDHCLENVKTKYPVWNAVGDTYFFQLKVAFDFPGDALVFCDGP